MIYLTLAELLFVAERTLGADYAVRDYGLLEAAVARTQATVFGKDAYPDLDSKAAALLQLRALPECLGLVIGKPQRHSHKMMVSLLIPGS